MATPSTPCFAPFADQTRRDILKMLRDGPRPPARLPADSTRAGRHLRRLSVLANASLVSPCASWRGGPLRAEYFGPQDVVQH
jgi:hypothetical protein